MAALYAQHYQYLIGWADTIMHEKLDYTHHPAEALKQEQLEKELQELAAREDSQEPCKAEETRVNTQSKYKKGRQWWNQSPWERKR